MVPERPEENAVRTIVFADIVDSTRIFEELGDEGARQLIVECLVVMEEAVKASHGTPLSRIGDEILCRFDDPDTAANAAGLMHQRIIAGFSEGRFPRAIRIRVGMAHGPVLETSEGLFGATVHTAARLAALAKAGQILTNRETLEKMSPARQALQRFYDRVVLKGQAYEQDLHEILWDTTSTIVPSARPAAARTAEPLVAVELRYGDVVRRVDASVPRLDIGRDAACGLQVRGSAVSRLHARIVYNRGKVRVEDVSTNGTCVEADGGSPATLHHDGASLKGKGVLRFGCIGPLEAAAIVSYRCLTGGEADAPDAG